MPLREGDAGKRMDNWPKNLQTLLPPLSHLIKVWCVGIVNGPSMI